MNKEENKNIFFAIIGITSSGKTELARHMVTKHGINYIPSLTTRPPRPGNLTEYKHISVDQFKIHIKEGELLEYTFYAGNYYGKLKDDVSDNLEKGHSVTAMTADRIKELKGLLGEQVKVICVSPNDPVLETAEKRLRARSYHSEKEIKTRRIAMTEELEVISNLKNENYIDYHVTTIDSDWSHALREIDRIAEKHKN